LRKNGSSDPTSLGLREGEDNDVVRTHTELDYEKREIKGYLEKIV